LGGKTRDYKRLHRASAAAARLITVFGIVD
jgi:hypothetical protein